MDGFIIAIVEESSFLVDFPSSRIWNSIKLLFGVRPGLDYLAKSLTFIDGLS